MRSVPSRFKEPSTAVRMFAGLLSSTPGPAPACETKPNFVATATSSHSEAFRTRCAAHDVRFHNTGVKHFNHPVVGELSLSFNRLDLAADHGLTIFTYAAEPGSRSEEALKLLGSWAATVDLAESAPATDQS